MKTLLAAAILTAIASQAGAQQIMDGSQGGSVALAQQLATGLVGKATDPYSAQFVRLVQNGKDVCGLVNLKNPSGGYTGFQPFLFSEGQVFLQQTSPCR